MGVFKRFLKGLKTLKIFSGKSFAAFLIILILFSVPVSGHDIHISYCQASVENNVLKGKLTIYRDDFEKALKNWAGNSSLSGDAHWQAKLKFLKEKFRAMENGKSLPLEISASGVDNSSIWFEFAFKNTGPIRKLQLQNSILFKEYDDQMNIIGIKTPFKEFNHIFTSSKRTMSVQL